MKAAYAALKGYIGSFFGVYRTPTAGSIGYLFRVFTMHGLALFALILLTPLTGVCQY